MMLALKVVETVAECSELCTTFLFYLYLLLSFLLLSLEIAHIFCPSHSFSQMTSTLTTFLPNMYSSETPALQITWILDNEEESQQVAGQTVPPGECCEPCLQYPCYSTASSHDMTLEEEDGYEARCCGETEATQCLQSDASNSQSGDSEHGNHIKNQHFQKLSNRHDEMQDHGSLFHQQQDSGGDILEQMHNCRVCSDGLSNDNSLNWLLSQSEDNSFSAYAELSHDSTVTRYNGCPQAAR